MLQLNLTEGCLIEVLVDLDVRNLGAAEHQLAQQATVVGHLVRRSVRAVATPHRGRNENTNGLIHQFLPKGANLSTVRRTQLNEIARLLNARPRKTLDWKRPDKAIAEEIAIFSKRVALDS